MLHRFALRAASTALLVLAASTAFAAPTAGLWPCIQPKVASLAAAQMWDGPPLDNLNWRDDKQVSELVPVLAARRTSIEEAETLIGQFAGQAGPDKKTRLSMLFAGVFDQINTRRARILSGIERYSQHQIELSQRIKDESLKVAQAKKAASADEDKAKAAELEKQLLWDTRIYDARSQAVTAVCESPVILEQRAFAIARAIQNVME
ncbi:MAG TPA: hypothetical protein VIQ29_06845 [Ancylobacter sp.]